MPRRSPVRPLGTCPNLTSAPAIAASLFSWFSSQGCVGEDDQSLTHVVCAHILLHAAHPLTKIGGEQRGANPDSLASAPLLGYSPGLSSDLSVDQTDQIAYIL